MALVVIVSGCAGSGDAHNLDPSIAPVPPPAEVVTFFDRYVLSDGRVVRWDQGGDSVSEGQAYAMFIASAFALQDIVDRVWSWTDEQLMQPNDLPAWRIDSDNQIADLHSAADADVLMAWSLLRSDGPRRAELRAAGFRLAEAIVRHEVITTPGGRRLLAAGPWAVEAGVVNVSYWSSALFADIAALTDDPVWSQLAQDAPEFLAELTDEGRRLPPDWARLSGENLEPTPSPIEVGSSPSDIPQYGLDAQRTVVWSAVSCDQQERGYAARWYDRVADPAHARALGLSLTGEILNPAPHPVPLVAAAAAARARGEDAAAEGLLTDAQHEYDTQPSFFGAAWIALGATLVTSRPALDLCGG